MTQQEELELLKQINKLATFAKEHREMLLAITESYLDSMKKTMGVMESMAERIKKLEQNAYH